MRKLWRDQRGFTLVEMLVGIGLLTIVMSTIGTGLFQAVGTEKGVVDDGLAITEIRKGLAWFSGDVKMAKTTNLVDGAPAVSSVTFNWTDQFGGANTAHTASYSLAGNSLVRTYDGIAHTVGRRAASASFSRSGRAITAQVTVDAGYSRTRTLSAKALMRPAP